MIDLWEQYFYSCEKYVTKYAGDATARSYREAFQQLIKELCTAFYASELIAKDYRTKRLS